MVRRHLVYDHLVCPQDVFYGRPIIGFLNTWSELSPCNGHHIKEIAEAMGMAPSGNAAVPAVESRRRVTAQLLERRIVQKVKADLKP